MTTSDNIDLSGISIPASVDLQLNALRRLHTVVFIFLMNSITKYFLSAFLKMISIRNDRVRKNKQCLQEQTSYFQI